LTRLGLAHQDLQDRLDRKAFGRRKSRLPQAKKIQLIQ
jgi:hypothetical protein